MWIGDWIQLGEKLTKGQRRLWQALQFLIRLAILAIPLYLVLLLNPSMAAWQAMVADHTEWLLRVSGLSVARDNLVLSVGAADPFEIFIGPDCTGWKSMFCYFALVFATLGVRMRKRLLGMLVGIPLIYLGNLARIVMVVFIERGYGYEAAMVVHDWLWQAGLIALVLGLWLGWLKYCYVKSRIMRLMAFLRGRYKNMNKHIMKLREK